MRRRLLLLACLLTMGALASTPVAFAANDDDGESPSAELRDAVELEDIRKHQRRFQGLADRAGGTRVSGTAGFDASADYVYRQARRAGYEVSFQEFEFAFFQELAPGQFERVSPNPTVYTVDMDFDVMDYSGSGDVTAPITVIDPVIPPVGGSTSGCEASDFASFPAGNIAVIQRGTCTFGEKAANAQAAGAVGVVIFNEGNAPDRVDLLPGTLGDPSITIPVIGTAFALGEELYNLAQAGPVELRILTSTVSEIRTTRNVIADSRTGDPNNVVVVGAHLDSVPEGPGINDNGSGSAAILEIAKELDDEFDVNDVDRRRDDDDDDKSDSDEDEDGDERRIADDGEDEGLRNRVRFIWFGAEEQGLFGSEFCVSSLPAEELAKIDLMINFDMIGSPNFVRFVYDGDGSAGLSDPGPPGSEAIEQVFLDYFASQGLANEPTALDGRSDYDSFAVAGIPVGGLFTGAEEIKTPEQAVVYGGTAGEQYDPCYHEACDTYDGTGVPLALQALDEMADATAHAVATFGFGEPLTAFTALAPIAIGALGAVNDGDDGDEVPEAA